MKLKRLICIFGYNKPMGLYYNISLNPKLAAVELDNLMRIFSSPTITYKKVGYVLLGKKNNIIKMWIRRY